MTKLKALLLILLISATSLAQDIAILKYDGGGDWYANPTSLPNLIEFCNKNIQTRINEKPKTVEATSIEIFNYPIIFMTGHGNVFLNDDAVQNLRNYLTSGGFLHISDNYGMNEYMKKEMKKVFPKLDFQEIPYNHPIYHQSYNFENGVPKIHEHNGKRSQGFGLFYEGELVCFYDYESDLSDGWEDASVHNNPQKIREESLKMGANIVEFAFKD